MISQISSKSPSPQRRIIDFLGVSYRTGGAMRASLRVIFAFVCFAAVAAPQRPFKVGLALDAPPAITGNCHPTRVHFTGRLNATAPGQAQYQWVRSDGANTALKTMNFSRPGPQPVTMDWMLTKSFNGWVALKLLSPIVVETRKVEFQVSCR